MRTRIDHIHGAVERHGAITVGTPRKLPVAVMAALDTLAMPAPPEGAKLVLADVDYVLQDVGIQKRLEIKEILHRFGLI
jgi:hypothetical protein